MKKHICRRAKCGAVFVESIVVISMFTLCFLGVVYFRELYLGKMRVQRLARASAMAHAMGACKGDPGAGLEKDMPKGSIQSLEPGKPFVLDAHGDSNAETALAKFDRSKAGTPFDTITKLTLVTSAAATTQKELRSNREGFVSREVSSASFVTCGDAVSEDRAVKVFSYISDIFDTF